MVIGSLQNQVCCALCKPWKSIKISDNDDRQPLNNNINVFTSPAFNCSALCGGRRELGEKHEGAIKIREISQGRDEMKKAENHWVKMPPKPPVVGFPKIRYKHEAVVVYPPTPNYILSSCDNYRQANYQRPPQVSFSLLVKAKSKIFVNAHSRLHNYIFQAFTLHDS